MDIKTTRPGWMEPLVLLAAALFLLTNLWQPITLFDEGYAAYGAWRIQCGAVPYADFFLNYAPGSFCVNAALFKLLGAKLLVLRLGDLGLRFLLAVYCGLLARRTGAGKASWLAFLGVLGLLGPMSAFGYAVQPAMVMVLGASLAWLRSIRTGSKAWALATGAQAGLAMLFRQDFGAYFLIAIALHTALFRIQARAAPLLRSLVWAWLSAALVASLFFMPFFAVAGPGRVWDLLVKGPLALVSGPYNLPLPSVAIAWKGLKAFLASGDPGALISTQVWVAFYGSLTVLLVASVVALWGLRRGWAPAAALSLEVALGALFLRQALNRTDLVHTYPFLFVALIALGGLFQVPRLRALAWPIASVMVFCFVVAPAVYWYHYVGRIQSLPLSKASESFGLVVPPDTLLAADWLQHYTRADETIFVANASMGESLVSNPMLYFFAQRRCASYYFIVEQPLPQAWIDDWSRCLDEPSTAAVVLWSGTSHPGGSLPIDRRFQGFGQLAGYYGSYEFRLRRPLEGL